MDESSAGVLEAVISQTGSELIMFFVVAAVIAIPVCMFIHNENKRKDRREAERHKELLEREKQLMDVISENSRVNAQLKTTLETFGEKNEKIGEKNEKSLDRVHLRIDDNAKEQAAIKDGIKDIRDGIKNILNLLKQKGWD